jgi:CSLREA domain-containing protein
MILIAGLEATSQTPLQRPLVHLASSRRGQRRKPPAVPRPDAQTRQQGPRPLRHKPIVMKTRGVVVCLVIGVALVALAASGLCARSSATDIEAGAAIAVTTTADELIDNGNCSLREAIQTINTHAAVDACSGDFETIELPSGNYTLTLAGPNEDDNAMGDLDIRSNVTIRGMGASPPWVDGNQLDRVLQVHTGATVAVTGVTISNGRASDGVSSGGGDGGDGGGIANAGTLTLRGCNISDKTIERVVAAMGPNQMSMAVTAVTEGA